MTPSRLVVAALLFCSQFLFAQENQQKTRPMENQRLLASSSQNSFFAPQTNPLGATPAQVPQDPLARAESGFRFKTNQNKTLLLFPAPSPDSVITPDQLAGGTTCYAIRSYVVARDNKNSDSVHPVSSSTCVSANKVQLKNATGSTPPAQLEK